MKIEFEKVVISNFMSFGRSEVILDEPGYTLVRGINNNNKDMAVSNGSGKSAIWEAITWVLTGETIRGCKRCKRILSKACRSYSVLFSLFSVFLL